MRIRLPAILIFAIASAGVGPSISQAQTCHGTEAALFLNVDGTDIQGEHPCSTLERTESILVLGFGSSSIVTPPGPTLPNFAGFHPATFVKPHDRSTPLLFQALVMRQTIEVAEFRFYSNESGTPVHTYSLTFRNAIISAISSAAGVGDEEPTESVSIGFDDATWTDVLNGIEFNWNGSGSS